MIKSFSFLITIMALLIIEPRNVSAYIGPGAGLTAVGTVIAVIVGTLLAILGFVWYPIKRLMKKIKEKREKKK